MVRIEVSKLVKGNLDHEDGSRLYHAIRDALKNGNVDLDFSNLDIVTSSFLNTSFRILAAEYDYNYLRSHISIHNSNKTINRMIKEYLNSAIK